MDAKEYIHHQMAGVRRLTDAVLQDVTGEQFNWVPPGTVNPMSTILVHILNGEDFFIQSFLQGKPRLWEAGGWGEKFGLKIPPGRGQGWEESRSTKLALAPLLEYRAAVRGATDVYLTNQTPEELDRPVDFIGGQRPVADVLATMMIHILGHTGEMAAIKGMQGAKGLPF